MIDYLNPSEIFVFGSNLEGQHMGGAAKQAYEQFGAIWGVGVGLAGQSYAIPTMFESVEQIRPFVEQFKQTAELLPQKTFLLTRVGTGIAGFNDDEIRPLFEDMPSNVVLPREWSNKKETIMTQLEADLDKILLQFIAEYHQGLNELAGHGTAIEQAKTALLKLIRETGKSELRNVMMQDGIENWEPYEIFRFMNERIKQLQGEQE